jgi:GT2 family glycosyltransferase
MPRVSIILINYNTFALTGDCIRSIIKHTKGAEYEIIVVDNASTETDAERFLIEFPSVRLVKSSVNAGFARGNNLGIEQATGEYILLLNNDTVLQEDSIGKALHYFIQQESPGVLGCRMVYPDQAIQYSARRFRSISWELLDLFRFIPYMMPYEKRAQRMLGKYFRHDKNIQPDWVNGAFFLFPKKILAQLPGGKLDERFFMYGEDQLWCWQIQQLGYNIFFYAGTTIIHIHGGSSDLNKQLALRKTMISHELVIMKARKGRGIYYFLFNLIYQAKERTRILIKWIVLKLTGKLIR